MPLETSSPGVFAVGDVRSGSVKRVAAGVGEGAAAVAQIHAYLAGLSRESLESKAMGERSFVRHDPGIDRSTNREGAYVA